VSDDKKAVVVNPEVIEKYQKLSVKLADPAMLKQLRSFFEKTCSPKELIDWVHARVEFTQAKIVRHNDPLEITDYGKGRCGEFSILYTALCTAHGYRARIVLDMSDHVWTEIWDSTQKRWIHVDPSDKRIDDPKMYERDWKKTLKEIYAFENGTKENVTKNYKLTNNQTT
jgi:hypothetical protein